MNNNLKSKEIYDKQIFNNELKINALFEKLFIFQYIFGIVCACIISPFTWIGEVKYIHPHVYSATILGLFLLIPQFLLFQMNPKSRILPYIIVITQVLQSILLIHITNGRIETHFHIFGSLAFIAFYRNQMLIFIASGLIAFDHFFRGYYYPESVYGISTIQPWRWLEHTGWVIFEDIFLLISIKMSKHEMQEISNKQAEIEAINIEIEKKIEMRTQELKHSEEKLQEKTQEVLDANKELEQFAYIASHDLQEPLRKVITYGELLKESLSKNIQEESNLYISKMQDASKRMQSLIVDLLQYSRLGFKEDKNDLIDLNVIVNEVINDLEIRIKETQTELNVCQLPTIKSDQSQMRQLFQNLISNSIKYSKKNTSPKINITCKILEDKNLLIEFEDNGIGFEDEHANKIFEPFKRLHTKSDYEGNGIGLAICKRIVNKCGGTIYARSKPNEGSKFYIMFPNRIILTKEK